MRCCAKQFGEFFEHGIGKIWLLAVVLFMTCYVGYFTITLVSPKAFPADTPIPFQFGQDLFIRKNHSGYTGYIRFEEGRVSLSGQQSAQQLIVKIVLEFQKDAQLRHDVRIEIFDKENHFISELLLRKESFAPVKSGYSYNIVTVSLLKYSVGEGAHFRYSFTRN